MIYWKAWDGAFQFRLVVVSLKDKASGVKDQQILQVVAHVIVAHQSPAEKGWLISLLELVMLLDGLQVEGRVDSHRENAQQLLSVGDVGYCRLRTVEEAQEDVASVGSVAVNLLCRLLGQAAHHTLHPAYRIAGNKEDEPDHFIPHDQKPFTKVSPNRLLFF